jgi:hypothetical protein
VFPVVVGAGGDVRLLPRARAQVFNVQQAYTTNAALENLFIDEAFPE